MDIETFTDTKTFLKCILHTNKFNNKTIEKIFVSNCHDFGITYFAYVHYIMSGLNEKSNNEKINHEKITLINKLLSTYIVEYFVNDSCFGSKVAITDLINYTNKNKTNDIINFIYTQCPTSVETILLMTKIYWNINTDSITKFELCEIINQLCTWKKFREFITEHRSWCYPTLRQNDSAFLTLLYGINYTPKTFNKIQTYLNKITNVFFNHKRVEFMKYITTIIKQNKFRTNDNWIMGLRTYRPYTSTSNMALINIFYNICKLWKHNYIPTVDISFSKFIKYIPEGSIHYDTQSPEYLFYMKCKSFDVVIFALIRKLKYVTKEYITLDVAIDNVIQEYTTNNGSILSIQSSLTNMFKSKILYLSKSTNIKNHFTVNITDSICRHITHFLNWVYINSIVESQYQDIIFTTCNYAILNMISNAFEVLNYFSDELAVYSHDRYDMYLYNICFLIIENDLIPAFQKTTILQYLNLHSEKNPLSLNQLQALLSYYGNRKYASDERNKQDSIIIKLISINIKSLDTRLIHKILPIKNQVKVMYVIINELSLRFESFQENYEFVRENYNIDASLTIQQVMTQEKYNKIADDKYDETSAILGNIISCIKYEDFRECLFKPELSDKLSDFFLYILQFSSQRLTRSLIVVSKVFDLIIKLLTYEKFAVRFINNCGSIRPNMLVNIQKKLCLNVFDSNKLFENSTGKQHSIFKVASNLFKKMHSIHTNMNLQINNIFDTLIHYEHTLFIYDEDDDDIPIEFIDPLMHTVITIPVMLPDCNNIIMDRTIICRYLQSKEENPFNRENLTIEELDAFNSTPETFQLIEKFKEKLNTWKNAYLLEQKKKIAKETVEDECIETKEETKEEVCETKEESKYSSK